MKKTRSFILAILLTAGLGLAAGLTGTGCQTTYKAEKAADITVTAAMTAWGDYVAQFHPPVEQEQKVKAAFEKYQAAQILAVDATKAMFDLTATNGISDPTATSVAKAKVSQASASAAGALADLVALIQSFGVKITQ